MENLILQSADSLEVLQRAEIDTQVATAKRYPRVVSNIVNEIATQVATAKRYPRVVSNIVNEIATLATLDEDTAASCFYNLPSRGNGAAIQGPSVRFAEIVASSWGNMRVQSRILGHDGKSVTAQAVCFDLEKNVAVSVEVKRSIVNKNGQTYKDDMIIVTGNAAASIAFRNAVFKVVPAAIIASVRDQVRQVAMGRATDLTTRRAKMVEWFNKAGVTTAELLELAGVAAVENLDAAKVLELRGLAVALQDGTTTIDEAIKQPLKEMRAQAVANAEANTAKEKVAKSMAKNAEK